jgi:hypothetical protein
MPVSERQRVIREAVQAIRENWGAPISDPALRDVYGQAESLAELLALVAAQARAEGDDEVIWAEVVLKAGGISRQSLLEAESTLALLGYGKLASLLRRLARTAKSRPPTFAERWRTARRRRAVFDIEIPHNILCERYARK